uniref:WAP domain-containing protein n=1 Tax=Periophthalmus magnuspinnatus TaxID=409849 RepID=A0A3B4AYQ9_9GOBI
MVRSVLCLLTVALAFVPLLSATNIEHIGICPDWHCSSDRDCEKNLKCCETGCGRLCMEPQRGNVTLRNTCGYLSVSLRANMTKTVRGTINAARPAVGKFVNHKPGVCPEPRTDIDPRVVRCLSECSTDCECEGNLKCCFNGCGNVCEKPRGNMSLRNTCGGCCFFKFCSWFLSNIMIKSYIILTPPLCINY